jgi:hypothetical protein
MKNYRLVWERYNNRKIPLGHQIHHIDGNHDNNNPENLVCVTVEEHAKLHAEMGKPWVANFILKQGFYSAHGENNPMWGRTHDSDARKKISKARKGCKDTDESRKRKSEAKLGENNPNYGKPGYWSDKKRPDHSIIMSEKMAGNCYGANRTDEGKQRAAEAASIAGKIMFRCFICGIETNRGNLTRWHNQKCKEKAY